MLASALFMLLGRFIAAKLFSLYIPRGPYFPEFNVGFGAFGGAPVYRGGVYYVKSVVDI